MSVTRVFMLLRRTSLVFAAAFASFPAAAGEATLAVAANFKPAMDALERAFEESSQHELTVVAGSTGKLYAQIVNGAPFDLFLAADQERPRRLEAEGMAVAGMRLTYAEGRIVLWDPNGGAVGPDRLAASDYRRLAIANPDLAPYGAAAVQVLSALDALEDHAPKIVRGENIGQAFAFVQTGNAELGFVALAQVLSLPGDIRGAYWTPPQDLYDPVRQDAVLLKRAAGNDAANAFMAFLKSEQATTIIDRFGYGAR